MGRRDAPFIETGSVSGVGSGTLTTGVGLQGEKVPLKIPLQVVLIGAGVLLAALAGSVPGCREALASQVTEEQAVRAVLGEARGEGYKGMYAVACALRNRIRITGDLKGVSGARAIMEPISGELYQVAGKAWHLSLLGPDVTHGATCWLSDYDLKRDLNTEWASGEGVQETAYIGHHHFYRERRHR